MSIEMPDRPWSGAHILVVDDETGMREGCRRALSLAGHTVDTAADLREGRSLVHSRQYDVHLIDVMLPDGSGLDLLGEILARDPDAVCIIITGFGSVEMAVTAVRQGAYDFLSKPFTSDELIMAVEQGLERRHLKAIEAEAVELTGVKEELERLDRVKSQLMLKVAHELRAPVAAAQSYINLITSGYVTQADMTSTLERIGQRLQEMLDLTTDLLELARLKETRERFASGASAQDMAEVLEEVSNLFREQARERGQEFTVEIRDHPTITANREHLRQIWTNLISNAIKYTPEGGRITARLELDGDLLLGVVEDTGIGIAEVDLPHLFQEFFRTDRARATGQIGTGLGLSIVKEIVNSYGGAIRITSKPGQGSRFAFLLPLEPHPEPGPALTGPPDSPITPHKTVGTRLQTHSRALADGRTSGGTGRY